MVLHPVGPEPASTYWFRRGVLVAIVIVLLLVLKACAGGGGASPKKKTGATPKPSVTPTATVTPKATTTPPANPARACADGELNLVVSTDKTSYAVGTRPEFTMVVTNKSSTACTRDLGPTVVAFEVVSGTARQWSSDDCEPASGHKATVLQPGKATQVSSITWSGKKSRKDCPSPRDQATAGTYQVFGNVGPLVSGRVVFHLT